jgi:hypothetical protein
LDKSRKEVENVLKEIDADAEPNLAEYRRVKDILKILILFCGK